MPYYLLYGMTPDQYWEGDPYLAVSYREYHRLKTERDNQNMWWSNVYTMNAFTSALSGTMFWIKKPIKYPAEAYRITPYSEEEQKANAEKERQKFISSMNAFKRAWDKKNG